MTLWNCKRLTKRIENYEKEKIKMELFIRKLKNWTRRDKKTLDSELKKLSKEENLKYGYEMGFIEEADFMIMANELAKNKEKESEKDDKCIKDSKEECT